MRVRMEDPAYLDELVAILGREPEAAIERLSDEEVEVSLPSSTAAQGIPMDLYLRLRAWEAARRAAGIGVEILR